MAISLVVLGYYFWIEDHEAAAPGPDWIPLLSLMIYILGFAIGFGPVAWLMMGELLGPDIKKFAFGIACVACLVCQTLAVASFQRLTLEVGRSITFWMYSSMCILAAMFVFPIPETKNKSLKEIQNELAGKSPKIAEIVTIAP